MALVDSRTTTFRLAPLDYRFASRISSQICKQRRLVYKFGLRLICDTEPLVFIPRDTAR